MTAMERAEKVLGELDQLVADPTLSPAQVCAALGIVSQYCLDHARACLGADGEPLPARVS
jgi:hypothetical protein